MTDLDYEKPRPRNRSAASILSAILLLGLSIPVADLVASSGAAVPLNSIQVDIQTSKSLPYQYTLTAYNVSGYEVANFYGNYPEASFGLPSGTYLITASANYQQSPPCYPCLGATANGSGYPIRYQAPSSEYGYAVEKVTGPSQITITTKNATDFPMVNMPVHVSFFNGTAAAGAYVSAYVVGMGYYYAPNSVSGGQTGANGNFTLVMPDVPVEVNAYLSVPVQLPTSVTTVQVTVGGQKVNVTVNYQPYYVSLSGQALILPPQKGADITLKVQQYPYPIYYNGPPTPLYGGITTATTVTSTTTAGAQQAGSSAQSNRIAPFNPTSAQFSAPAQAVSSSVPPSPVTVLVLAFGSGAAAMIVLAAAMIMGKRKQAVHSARP